MVMMDSGLKIVLVVFELDKDQRYWVWSLFIVSCMQVLYCFGKNILDNDHNFENGGDQEENIKNGGIFA